MPWIEREEVWHRVEVAYCEVTGQLLPKRYWAFEHDGRTIRARNPHCEELFRWRLAHGQGDAHQSATAPSE